MWQYLKQILIGFFMVCCSNFVFAADAAATATALIDYPAQIQRVLGVLLLMLAGIFAAAWLMKKIGLTGHTTSDGLKVKASLALTKKDTLYVVEVGNEQLLIGVNAGGISSLKNLENPIAESKPFQTGASDFAKKMQVMLSEKLVESK